MNVRWFHGSTFAVIPTWILDEASASAVKLFAILVTFADGTSGEAEPRRKVLADRMRCSLPTLDKHLAELESLGAITVTRRQHRDGSLRANLYELHAVPRGGSQEILARSPSALTNSKELDPVELEAGVSKEPETPASKSRRTKPARPSDPLWDALVEIFGAEASGLERGRWNKALKGLREAGATPVQLRGAALRYPQVMPAGCLMTATALAANWTLLTAEPKGEAVLRFESGRDEWREQMIAKRGWA